MHYRPVPNLIECPQFDRPLGTFDEEDPSELAGAKDGIQFGHRGVKGGLERDRSTIGAKPVERPGYQVRADGHASLSDEKY
jgi:hypothetical protein